LPKKADYVKTPNVLKNLFEFYQPGYTYVDQDL